MDEMFVSSRKLQPVTEFNTQIIDRIACKGINILTILILNICNSQIARNASWRHG